PNAPHSTPREIRSRRRATLSDGTGNYSPTPKKQNPVPRGHTPCPKGSHTDNQKPGQKRSKCIPKGHIDLVASMYPKGSHNCLPPPLTPMCWSTPTVVEVVDVVERNAIRTMFWRAEITRRR